MNDQDKKAATDFKRKNSESPLRRVIMDEDEDDQYDAENNSGAANQTHPILNIIKKDSPQKLSADEESKQ